MTLKRPQTFQEIIGQEQAKYNCQIILQSAKKRNDALPHTLFVGPSGTGKTTFATVLANEFQSNLYRINAGNVRNVNGLSHIFNRLAFQDIVFIDEIHRLSLSVCESLYTVMEDFRLDNSPLPKFTIIGATTESLPKPLRDRFKHVQEFVEYSTEELVQLVHRTLTPYDFKLSDKAATVIAQSCRGNPRMIINRGEWVRDYMTVNKQSKMSIETLKEVIFSQGVDLLGLEKQDRGYLTVLKHGPLGLRSIACKLNLTQNVVEKDIEPYLMKLGLVEVTSSGRRLTFKGMNYE